MNIVLHSADWEPITVIDLPVDVLKKLQKTGGINLVIKDTKYECFVLCFKIPNGPFLYVTAKDEEALMLKASYLPGQHTKLRKITK